MKRYCIIIAALIIASPLLGLAMEEPQTRLAPPQSQEQIDRGPLIDALEQARIDGDIGLVRSLEAQIPVPKTIGGEAAAAPYVPRVSETVNGTREYAAAPDGTEAFGLDVKVSNPWPDDREREPSMASDSIGNLYIVWHDDDDVTGLFWLHVWKSINGGATWSPFGSLTSANSLETPSIAVGEGITNGNVLLVAYVVDDQTNPRYVEVATAPLAGGSFTVNAVSLWAWDYYTPVIWTDSHTYNFWYAFMTAEAVVFGLPTNRNVTFSRSTNGTTWDTHQVLWGNTDDLAWIDPDGTFGTSSRDVFVVCYNDTNDELFYMHSADGITFDPQVSLGIPDIPMGAEVDPDIEASIDDTNLMIGLTWRFSTSTTDDVGYMYSEDTGATWGGPYNNWAEANTQRGVEVTANEGGHGFHFAWTDSLLGVVRATRPQDMTWWTTLPEVVTDAGAEASISYPKKGIASHWNSDEVGIAWADFRLGLPIYEIYYDASEPNLGMIFHDNFESGNTSAWN